MPIWLLYFFLTCEVKGTLFHFPLSKSRTLKFPWLVQNPDFWSSVNFLWQLIQNITKGSPENLMGPSYPQTAATPGNGPSLPWRGQGGQVEGHPVSASSRPLVPLFPYGR